MKTTPTPSLTLHQRLVLRINILRNTNAPDTHSTKRGRAESQLWHTERADDIADSIIDALGEPKTFVLVTGEVVKGWEK